MKKILILSLIFFSSSLFSADWTIFYKDPEGLENHGMDYYYDKTSLTKTSEGYKKVDILVNLKSASYFEPNKILDCKHNKYKSLTSTKRFDGPFATGTAEELKDSTLDHWDDLDPHYWKLIKTVCSEKDRAPGVKIGDTADFVIKKSSWGKPKEVHTTTTKYGSHEQWVYGDGNYLYLDNGVVTAIQN